jgi:hypothetical protein
VGKSILVESHDDSHTTLVENIAKKDPQSFSHHGSFDHPNLQSLNDYNFFPLGLPTKILGILGFFYVPLERS